MTIKFWALACFQPKFKNHKIYAKLILLFTLNNIAENVQNLIDRDSALKSFGRSCVGLESFTVRRNTIFLVRDKQKLKT